MIMQAMFFSVKPLAASKSLLYSSLQLLRLLVAGYDVPIEEPFGVGKGVTHRPGDLCMLTGASSSVAKT